MAESIPVNVEFRSRLSSLVLARTRLLKSSLRHGCVSPVVVTLTKLADHFFLFVGRSEKP